MKENRENRALIMEAARVVFCNLRTDPERLKESDFLKLILSIPREDKKVHAEMAAYSLGEAARCIRDSLGLDEAAAFLAVLSNGGMSDRGNAFHFLVGRISDAEEIFEKVRQDYLEGKPVYLPLWDGTSVPLVGGRDFSREFAGKDFASILDIYESIRGPKRRGAELLKALDEIGPIGKENVDALLEEARKALWFVDC